MKLINVNNITHDGDENRYYKLTVNAFDGFEVGMGKTTLLNRYMSLSPAPVEDETIVDGARVRMCVDGSCLVNADDISLVAYQEGSFNWDYFYNHILPHSTSVDKLIANQLVAIGHYNEKLYYILKQVLNLYAEKYFSHLADAPTEIQILFSRDPLSSAVQFTFASWRKMFATASEEDAETMADYIIEKLRDNCHIRQNLLGPINYEFLFKYDSYLTNTSFDGDRHRFWTWCYNNMIRRNRYHETKKFYPTFEEYVKFFSNSIPENKLLSILSDKYNTIFNPKNNNDPILSLCLSQIKKIK